MRHLWELVTGASNGARIIAKMLHFSSENGAEDVRECLCNLSRLPSVCNMGIEKKKSYLLEMNGAVGKGSKAV